MKTLLSLFTALAFALCARAQEKQIRFVNSVTQLLTVTPGNPDALYIVGGTNSIYDGGSGIWFWFAGDTQATNTCCVFATTTPAGRWKMLPTDLNMFGTNVTWTQTNITITASGGSSTNYYFDGTQFSSGTNVSILSGAVVTNLVVKSSAGHLDAIQASVNSTNVIFPTVSSWQMKVGTSAMGQYVFGDTMFDFSSDYGVELNINTNNFFFFLPGVGGTNIFTTNGLSTAAGLSGYVWPRAHTNGLWVDDGTGRFYQATVGAGLSLASGALTATSGGFTNTFSANQFNLAGGTNVTIKSGSLQTNTQFYSSGTGGVFAYVYDAKPQFLFGYPSGNPDYTFPAISFQLNNQYGFDLAVGGYLESIINGSERWRVDSSGGKATSAGSAASPSVANSTATSSGLFWPNSGAMALSAGGVEILTMTNSGAIFQTNIYIPKTITTPGTTGAQTINKVAGRVNFAAGAASLVVTDNLVTANSTILVSIGTHDTTATGLQVVAASGSFTIYLLTVPTAETAVNFMVFN